MAGLVNGGCYTYAPIAFDAVKPKEDVRLRITDGAATRLSQDLGAFSTQIDGEFSRQSADSVSIGISIDRASENVCVVVPIVIPR